MLQSISSRLPKQCIRRFPSQAFLPFQSITTYAALPVRGGDLSVMVFGAGTDVGKTIICAGLSMAALQANQRVCYIKPVQTGSLDEYFIQLYCNPRGINDIFVRTLQHWKINVSPHLAHRVDKTGGAPVTDQELLSGIQREMKTFSDIGAEIPEKHRKSPFIVVETAGGALSPGPNRTLQADVYRALRLPVVLVADGRLGGISATLTSYESLRLRGYTIHAIVMIAQDSNDTLGNSVTIQEHLDALYRSVPGDTPEYSPKDTSSISSASSSPPRWSLQRSPRVFTLSPLSNDRNQLLHNWFQHNMSTFLDVFRHVQQSEAEELRSYVYMHREGLKKVWWPFTNYYKVRPEDVGFIESAHGDHYRVITYPNSSNSTDSNAHNHSKANAKPVSINTTGNSKGHADVAAVDSSDNGTSDKAVFVSAFDGSASWWTQAVGHGHADVAIALAEAAGRYGHVLFPRHLHAPAVQLSRYLTEKGPGKDWASRVFFSENESSANEVGLKMAFRLAQHRRDTKSGTTTTSTNYNRKMMVLSQRGAFHGDSVGTMNMATSSVARTPLTSHTDTHHPWYDSSQSVSIATPCVAYEKGHLRLQVQDLQDEGIARVVHGYTNSSELNNHAFDDGQSMHMNFHQISDLFNLSKRIHSPLAHEYKRYISSFLQSMPTEVAVLVIEPLLIATGGMRFIDPLFQHLLIQLAKQPPYALVVLCDETVTGLYRMGPVAAMQWVQQTPDVACYAKMLTGGYVPLAVTLASEEVFHAFYPTDTISNMNKSEDVGHDEVAENHQQHLHHHSDNIMSVNATAHFSSAPPLLMHGHSFSASPVACAAALETIRLLENSPRLVPHHYSMSARLDAYDDNHHGSNQKVKEVHSQTMQASFSDEDLRVVSKLPGVHSAMSLGSVLAIHLLPAPIANCPTTITTTADDSANYITNDDNYATSASSSPALTVIRLLRQERVFARHIGQLSVGLLVTPYTSDYDQQRLLRVLRRVLTKAFYTRIASATAIGTNSNIIDSGGSTGDSSPTFYAPRE